MSFRYMHTDLSSNPKNPWKGLHNWQKSMPIWKPKAPLQNSLTCALINTVFLMKRYWFSSKCCSSQHHLLLIYYWNFLVFTRYLINFKIEIIISVSQSRKSASQRPKGILPKMRESEYTFHFMLYYASFSPLIS